MRKKKEWLHMEKKNIDWANLGFGYYKTDKRYVSNFKDGKWDEGCITDDATVAISECAGVIHYCQTCFEGMKAYTTEDGHVVVFRPDMNAKRMVDTATRLEIPPFPVERFIDAVEQVVKANLEYVPPFGTGAALYIRPVLFATGAVMGVKPATEYQFRIFVPPVGPYFKNGGSNSIVLKVSDYDRSAPHGTGHIKAGLNYAMSLYPIVKAHEEGFNENMYLDPQTRTKVEETGGANFFFVTKDNKVVTPKSPSILPSITRRSLMALAKDLGYETEEREVYLSELGDFVECGLCGTAAVISPVGKVNDHGKEIVFANSQHGMGPVSKKLYDTLTGIQFGKIQGPEGWVKVIV